MRLSSSSRYVYPLCLVGLVVSLLSMLIGAPKASENPTLARLVFAGAMAPRPLFVHTKTSGSAYFFRKNPPKFVQVLNVAPIKNLSLECVARYPVNVQVKSIPIKLVAKQVSMFNGQYLHWFTLPKLTPGIWPRCSLISIKAAGVSTSWNVAQLWQNVSSTAVGDSMPGKRVALEARPSLDLSEELAIDNFATSVFPTIGAKSTSYRSVFTLLDKKGGQVLQTISTVSGQPKLVCPAAEAGTCSVVNGSAGLGLEQVSTDTGAIQYIGSSYATGSSTCGPSVMLSKKLASVKGACQKTFETPLLRVEFLNANMISDTEITIPLEASELPPVSPTTDGKPTIKGTPPAGKTPTPSPPKSPTPDGKHPPGGTPYPDPSPTSPAKTPTRTPTKTPTVSPTPITSPTETPIPTATSTPFPTVTATPIPTITATLTATPLGPFDPCACGGDVFKMDPRCDSSLSPDIIRVMCSCVAVTKQNKGTCYGIGPTCLCGALKDKDGEIRRYILSNSGLYPPNFLRDYDSGPGIAGQVLSTECVNWQGC